MALTLKRVIKIAAYIFLALVAFVLSFLARTPGHTTSMSDVFGAERAYADAPPPPPPPWWPGGGSAGCVSGGSVGCGVADPGGGDGGSAGASGCFDGNGTASAGCSASNCGTAGGATTEGDSTSAGS